MDNIPQWARYAISLALGFLLAWLGKSGITPAPVPALPFNTGQPAVFFIGTGPAPYQTYSGDRPGCGCHAPESKAEIK